MTATAPSTWRGRLTAARHSRTGSVILTGDFSIGVLGGVGSGAAPAFSKAVQMGMQPIYLGFAAIGVALVSVVLAAHTLISTLISSEYLEIIQRTTGGVKGLSRPYLFTVAIAAVAAIISLIVGLIWPAVPDSQSVGWIFGRWSLTSLAAIPTFWAMLASAKLVGLGAFHVESRASLLGILASAKERRRYPDRN